MRSAALVSAALVFGLAVSPLADAAKTFRPKGAELTFRLPDGWKGTHPERGWTFEAIAPNFHAWVFLSASRAVVFDRSFLGSFVTFQRKQTRSLGPHVIFRTKRTTIGTVPAIETIASGRGTTTEFAYGFQNAGREYVLLYATTAAYLPLEKTAFAKSISSLRFLASS